MNVLVCGGRDYWDEQLVWFELNRLDPDLVTTGGCRTGADYFARRWAARHKRIERTYWADWKRYGKKAGPIRNQLMLDREKPDLILAFPGGRGTQDMVNRAIAGGFQVKHCGA